MDKTCPCCNKVFRVKSSQSDRTFCSRDCLNKSTVQLICEVCGNEFTAQAIAAKKAKYCSDPCRVKSGPIKKNCERCGKSFSVRSNRVESARYCSYECAFAGSRKIIICEWCNTEFERPISSQTKFCSASCAYHGLERQVWLVCEWCGVDFHVKESYKERAHFCSKICYSDSMALPRNFPEPPLVDGAKWVQLGHEKFALVDEDDFLWISKFRWNEHKGYAYRGEHINGCFIHFSMHRLIINALPFIEVDHVSGNKLDNRKLNLRFATRSENAMNRVNRGVGSSSGYRGVYLTDEGNFKSMITHDSKQFYMGTFNDAVTAAQVYDEMARELFGEYARLNFPKEGGQHA